MQRWYVVNTQPRAEFRAETHLANQGFETWLPSLRKTRRHARRVDTVQAPLFPGYLFVRLDLDNQAWSAINGTWGVLRVLCQDGRPLPLPQGFVDALLDSADESGCITLPERGLEKGQRLRITGGPYQEYVGTLLDLPSRDRVAVLLHAFNRNVTATVPREFVVPA